MEYELRYPSPVGLLTLRAGEKGITVLVLPEDKQAETRLAPPATPCQREDAPPALARAARWLDAYFAGRAPDPSAAPGPSAARWAGIPSVSLCPATGWWGPMAASPVTPAE